MNDTKGLQDRTKPGFPFPPDPIKGYEADTLQLLRELFYARVGVGEKVADWIAESNDHLYRTVYARLHPEAVGGDAVAPEAQRCSECGHDIDPDVCWCGTERKLHDQEQGHSFVPMGCTCGYTPERRKEQP